MDLVNTRNSPNYLLVWAMITKTKKKYFRVLISGK